MPRVSSIEILKQMKQPTIAIRTRTKVDDLPMLIGQSYGRLGAYLHELGEFMTDVPYVAYHNMDMENLDVEIGFPVFRELPEKDDIKAGFIEEGKALFCMYRGSYQEMGPVYDEMAKWINDNGYESKGMSYEYYYNGPGFPESEYLTKIIMPLK